MSDSDENIIDKSYKEFLHLQSNIIFKDLTMLIENILCILNKEYESDKSKIIHAYISKLNKLGESVCYTPPEMIKYKEVDLYNTLIDFDSSNLENSSLKDALKMLWNKYKSEFKSTDL
jgi:hypothetical protein